MSYSLTEKKRIRNNFGSKESIEKNIIEINKTLNRLQIELIKIWRKLFLQVQGVI